MDKEFPWLCGFIASQLALMAVAAMPLERWRSFQTVPGQAPPKETRDVKFVPPKLATSE
jgi:hypothetical protein